MTPPITSEEAISLLRQHPDAYRTPEQLRALAARVDADATGRTTVVYSGPTARGVWSSDVIDAMLASGEDIRVINTSEASKLLNSREFLSSVADAYDLNGIRSLTDASKDHPAKVWLYHPTEGPWADASARFADATVGEVRAIVSDAPLDRVFGATELPHLLNNPSVTSIEGIPRETLAARQASQGGNAAFDMVAARSYENVGALRVAVDSAGDVLRGTTGQPILDSRAYFAQTGIETRVPEPSTPTQPLSSRMNPPSASVLAGRSGIESLDLDMPDRVRTPRLGGAGRALGIAGLALEAYDGAQSYRTASRLRGEGNDTAADSELIHFGSRSIGGLGGAAIGAGAGGAVTSWSGPGMLIGGTVGGIVGVFGGEKFAQWTDNRSIYNQQDRSGNTWTFDPEQPGAGWQRRAPIDASSDGVDNARRGDVRASPETANELNFQATTRSVELILGSPPPQRDPFTQPANGQDTESSRPSSWERNPDSGQWTRTVYGPFVERGMTPRHVEAATPERAAQLDQAAARVVVENASNSRASIAARYEDAYIQNGWARFGQMPDAVRNRRTDIDMLIASDDNLYQRQPDGRWVSDGMIYDSTASGSLQQELEATRTVLSERLPPPRQIVPVPPMTAEERLRDSVAGAYLNAGIEASPERITAAATAVRGTWTANGLDPDTTALAIRPDGTGRYGLDSPIGSMRLEEDGRTYRIAATTSIDEIRAAETEQRQPQPQTRAAAEQEPDAIPTLAAVSATVPAGTRRRDEEAPLPEPIAQTRSAVRLADNPLHPDHDTFSRIHTWVLGTGQWDEDKSRNIASALYREQAGDPLIQRVDRVTGALGRNGEENVFAVYAPFGDKGPFLHASVDGREAGQQSAQQNLEQAEQFNLQLAQQDQLEQQQRNQRSPQTAMA